MVLAHAFLQIQIHETCDDEKSRISTAWRKRHGTCKWIELLQKKQLRDYSSEIMHQELQMTVWLSCHSSRFSITFYANQRIPLITSVYKFRSSDVSTIYLLACLLTVSNDSIYIFQLNIEIHQYRTVCKEILKLQEVIYSRNFGTDSFLKVSISMKRLIFFFSFCTHSSNFHPFEMDGIHSSRNSNMLTMTNEWVSVKHDKGDCKIKATNMDIWNSILSKHTPLREIPNLFNAKLNSKRCWNIDLRSIHRHWTPGRDVWSNWNFWSKMWYGKSMWWIQKQQL